MNSTRSVIDNVLRIINLLQFRSFVKLDDIVDACGIHPRTAYRYLNSLSEANLAIEYDRKVGGYRLASQTRYRFDGMAYTDALVLDSLLSQWTAGADSERDRDLLEIIGRVRTCLPGHESTETATKAETNIDQVSPARLSTLMQLVLVSLMEQAARIEYLHEGQIVSIRLARPRLQIRGRCELVDAAAVEDAGIAVGDIISCQAVAPDAADRRPVTAKSVREALTFLIACEKRPIDRRPTPVR